MQGSLQKLQSILERSLLEHLPKCGLIGGRPLDDALRYAVFPGGKRMRPILSILGARIFSDNVEQALPAACGVEYIHTCSLVFDDLPCMDDASMRRGQPALHCVFGEEVALLAGLALLNQSYAIFGNTPALIAEATYCIGVDGMIGGQSLDLAPAGTGAIPGQTQQERLAERNRKTSAMMRLALSAGALSCGVPPSDAAALGAAGHLLGQAYQIGDDLIDARQSSQETGKTSGQDGRHGRPSHSDLGHGTAIDQVAELVETSRRTLIDAYGVNRVNDLLRFVDRAFAALIAEPDRSNGISVGGPEE